jgi:hypothetical protein
MSLPPVQSWSNGWVGPDPFSHPHLTRTPLTASAGRQSLLPWISTKSFFGILRRASSTTSLG